MVGTVVLQKTFLWEKVNKERSRIETDHLGGSVTRGTDVLSDTLNERPKMEPLFLMFRHFIRYVSLSHVSHDLSFPFLMYINDVRV